MAPLLEAEETQIRFEETRITVEETCTGKPHGSSCWKELANHPQCFVWDSHFYEDQTVTWSGNRYGSVAHGQGRLIWAHGDQQSSEMGRLEKGKKHGHWIERGSNVEAMGPYVDGIPDGHWVVSWDDGYKEKREWVG